MNRSVNEMNRRTFLQTTSIAAAAIWSGAQNTLADAPSASPGALENQSVDASSTTELFLDNKFLEATPGVSRRLHPAKKHLLNPVIRCDRWCDGDYIEPYTTMYDEEEKL